MSESINRRSALAMLAALPGIACGKVATEPKREFCVTAELTCETRIGRVGKVLANSISVVVYDPDSLKRTGEVISVYADPAGLNAGTLVGVARPYINGRCIGDWFVIRVDVEAGGILYASVDETPELVGKIRVLVDGKELKGCIRADVLAGECEAFQLNSAGQKFFCHGNDAARHIVRGTVRIERIA